MSLPDVQLTDFLAGRDDAVRQLALARHDVDPAGLLEGTGKVHRHVKIRAESDLGADLRAQFRRALDRRKADG